MTRNKHATELNYENAFLLGGENKIKEPHISNFPNGANSEN